MKKQVNVLLTAGQYEALRKIADRQQFRTTVADVVRSIIADFLTGYPGSHSGKGDARGAPAGTNGGGGDI